MPSDDGRKEPRWQPQPQGTWLVIPYDEADVGARPLPEGERFWESPAIRVVGGDAFGNPTGGQPVQVTATVHNDLGAADAAPLRVDFAFVAPSLGILPSAPQPIGTAWDSLPAGYAKEIPCPTVWIPPAQTSNLHACLIVTCAAPVFGDQARFVGSPRLDRQTGQRNLTVLSAQPGQTLQFRLQVANLGLRKDAIQLVAAAEWNKRAPQLGIPVLGDISLRIATAKAAAFTTDPTAARMWALRSAALTARGSKPSSLRLDDITHLIQVRSANNVRDGGTSLRPLTGAHPLAALPYQALGQPMLMDQGQDSEILLDFAVPNDARGEVLDVYLAQSGIEGIQGGYTVRLLYNTDTRPAHPPT